MKVQQLFLRNVRSIKSLDLDFRDPVTGKPMSRVVLAGANGSGKTTILESIFDLMAAAPRYHEARLEIPYFFLDAQLQIIFEATLPNRPATALSISYGDNIAAHEPGAYTEGKHIERNPRQLPNFLKRFAGRLGGKARLRAQFCIFHTTDTCQPCPRVNWALSRKFTNGLTAIKLLTSGKAQQRVTCFRSTILTLRTATGRCLPTVSARRLRS